MTAAIRFDIVDGPSATAAVAAAVERVGGRIRTLSTVRPIEGDPPLVEIEMEVEGATEDALVEALDALDDVRTIHRTRALGTVFGKRIIVVGGGADVATHDRARQYQEPRSRQVRHGPHRGRDVRLAHEGDRVDRDPLAAQVVAIRLAHGTERDLRDLRPTADNDDPLAEHGA